MSAYQTPVLAALLVVILAALVVPPILFLLETSLTDASGVEVQRQKYRPFGDRLSTSTTHVESRGFTGQRQDESGLFFLHARYFEQLSVGAIATRNRSSATAVSSLLFRGRKELQACMERNP